MNECPFCGMDLDCNNNVFICHDCDQIWIRITNQSKRIIDMINKDNEQN